MYSGRGRHLGDFSEILGDILNTGEQIVRDVRTPVYTNPSLNLPNYNPYTGISQAALYPQGSSLTMPLLLGGGVLLVYLLTRGRK
jgi:hypothetical protein